MLLKKAKANTTLCVGMEFTVPACKPMYMLAQLIAEPKTTAHAMALRLIASLTDVRAGSASDSGTDPSC